MHWRRRGDGTMSNSRSHRTYGPLGPADDTHNQNKQWAPPKFPTWPQKVSLPVLARSQDAFRPPRASCACSERKQAASLQL